MSTAHTFGGSGDAREFSPGEWANMWRRGRSCAVALHRSFEQRAELVVHRELVEVGNGLAARAEYGVGYLDDSDRVHFGTANR